LADEGDGDVERSGVVGGGEEGGGVGRDGVGRDGVEGGGVALAGFSAWSVFMPNKLAASGTDLVVKPDRVMRILPSAFTILMSNSAIWAFVFIGST